MDIDEAYYAAIDLLKVLIATPSVSRQEDKVANIIEQHLVQAGHSPKRMGNNVWVEGKVIDGRPTLLLNSHIDTVKPVSGWDTDPFSPILVDETLYGLGSNDAGASLVSLLYTFLTLDHDTTPYNLIFLATCEEEVSGKNGMAIMYPLLPPIDVAIVGEPTGMQAAIAEKGLMVLDCISHGISGHAARNEGVNAIYKAIEDINILRNTNFDRISSLLGEIKLTVTQIEAGTQHNVIPNECRFVIDVRSNELYTNDELLAILQQRVESQLTARSLHLNSSYIDITHPLIQRAIMLGRTTYGSPTMSDQTHIKCPSFKMGPGESARSHTSNEYIKLSEIREALTIYTKLLQ